MPANPVQTLVRILMVIALAAVLLGSLLPSGIKPLPVDLPDQKHFLAYGLLGVLWTWGLGVRFRVALAVAAALALVGFGVELLQGVIPGRYFRWSDAGLNALGAVSGALGCWLVATGWRWLRR